MDLTIRAATSTERLYAYKQCLEISRICESQGNIWGLLEESGSNIEWFWNTSMTLNISEHFKKELDIVIDLLRFDGRYGMSLQNTTVMWAYCLYVPESRVDDTKVFIFRVDTGSYTYLIRCSPKDKSKHFSIYPYLKTALTSHMKEAEKGITFSTPKEERKFIVPDGEHIRIIQGTGEIQDCTVRYIDSAHIEIIRKDKSNNISVLEFTTQLEQSGGFVIPMRSTLPDRCLVFVETTNEIGLVKKGESGYYLTDHTTPDREWNKAFVQETNEKLGLTLAQVKAMTYGSMFGWYTLAADPDNYDEHGHLRKPDKDN